MDVLNWIKSLFFPKKRRIQSLDTKEVKPTIQKDLQEKGKQMFKFSPKSKAKLNTAHPDLVKLFNEVIKVVDCTVTYGIRTREEQEELVRTGKSRTMNSKHLKQADGYAHAVDVVICDPIDWNNTKRFYYFAGIVKGIAAQLDIAIRCLADRDWETNDYINCMSISISLF